MYIDDLCGQIKQAPINISYPLTDFGFTLQIKIGTYVADNKDILTIPQAAKICSVDRKTMWRWVKTGNIKVSVTPGGHYRILWEDLEYFLRDRGMYPLVKKHFSSQKILIVDDDISVQKVLGNTLTAHKFITDIASDGFEAGIKVMQFKPDLIILDLIIPGMNGFEVCKILKSQPETSSIKIIAITGYDTHENKQKIFAFGADDYMEKPLKFELLLQKIGTLLSTSSPWTTVVNKSAQ